MRPLSTWTLAAVVALTAWGAAVAAAPPAMPAPLTKAQIEQKLRLAHMLSEKSKLAYRLDHAGADGRRQLAAVRREVQAAQAALDAGQLAQAAAAADHALETMSAAARGLPAQPDDAALRYKELSDALSTYKDAYDRNYRRLTAQEGAAAVGTPLNEREYDYMVAEAKAAAGRGDLAGANRVLAVAQRRITKALTVLLKGQTIVYDKHFDSPAQEYRYESDRQESYAGLVPKALAERKPSPHAVDLIHQFVDQSASMKDKAAQEAQAGRYQDAIATLQQSTAQLQRALWIAGVRWPQWPE